VGILHTIKESGAFKAGSTGADTIPQLIEFGDRIDYVQGKVGFNAFSNTRLDDVLRGRGIRDVLVCGMVTSLCIDSTGRAAYERGYSVTILADCTSARTRAEHQFFCENIFPLYGSVAEGSRLAAELLSAAA
jgi:nicotinamidase-related amidase